MKTGESDAGASAPPAVPAADAPSLPQHDGCTTPSALLPAMERIDPFLRFLTKATGKTSVPLKLLRQVLPKSHAEDGDNGDGKQGDGTNGNGGGGREQDDGQLHEVLLELTRRGVLNYEPGKETVGFPLPPSPSNSNDATTTQQSAVGADVKPPSKLVGKGLHGSSEPAAKRRMKVLKWTLEKMPSWISRGGTSAAAEGGSAEKKKGDEQKKAKGKRKRSVKKAKGNGDTTASSVDTVDEKNAKQPADDAIADADERLDKCHERGAAYRALDGLLRGWSDGVEKQKDESEEGTTKEDAEKQSAKQWLPGQAAYAGSHPGREARYLSLSEKTRVKIPLEVMQLFGLEAEGGSTNARDISSGPKRRLFLHQARAIESAMNNVHTVVQTATGSGKSFCFLLPVLAKAMVSLQQCRQRGDNAPGIAALLLFPTKALAQDQYSKINALLQSLPANDSSGSNAALRAGVLDGDTPHAQRDEVATECQIVLTNPDTLHAALLPNWKKKPAYQKLLARVATVVVDEAHVYEGAFGAHVAMVLARLKRVCRAASSPSNAEHVESHLPLAPLFIACSATMLHPEKHFRLLCPIGTNEEVCVLTSKEDGSPCCPKHFFVWNPPILDQNGNSTESIFLPKHANKGADEKADAMEDADDDNDPNKEGEFVHIPIGSPKRRRRKRFKGGASADHTALRHRSNVLNRRRHAADESAFLLAKAICAGVRTIAFCRTRSLVEWVYERCLSILQSDPKTSHLTSKVESYRGGYTAEARRSIEERLFQRKLWGVVGTNALELGVDVGGVDLTIHTGYPGSISSLLQQSGRAGRGKGSEVPSCAIMVCFSSPSEQYIWKNPSTLLSRGVDAPPTLPINGTVMQGHLLCAGEEFPLTGDRPVTSLLNEFGSQESQESCPPDCELLGPSDVYEENVEFLSRKGLLSKKLVNVVSGPSGVESVDVYSTHPVVKNPWKRVSLRSIEPLSYSIVDLSHNLQGGKTDKIHDQAAVMDTIPYSRVFYHAFPGAIIMHRGRKFRIESMESPPAFVGGASFGPCGCSNLMAFAKPTSLQYSTQALSVNQITVVKQMGHDEMSSECIEGSLLKSSEEGKSALEEKEKELQSNNQSVVAGHGIVTCKRSVHGYKKLSHVNRKELSRTTISLPPMEFDTYACWLPTPNLRDVINDFDGGVHALSHAMVAIAPLFVPCTSSDIDCDHSRYDCTRVLLFDKRAGGSGVTAQLYNHITEALQAAVDLLVECTSCYSEKRYDGGCPACLQSVSCDNFHQDLSRTAGIHIGRCMIERLQSSSLKSKKVLTRGGGDDEREGAPTKRKLVQSKLRSVNDMQSSVKPKNIVIGRASWSPAKGRERFAEMDE